MTQIVSQNPAATHGAPPPADAFPAHSVGWHIFAHTDAFADGPVSRERFGKSLVGFRTAAGTYAIMDARCSHFGADLARGTLHGDCLRCPFHHWDYAPDGHCVHIPAQSEIPRFARQRTYPAQTMGPYLFVFNGHEALYPLPFFPGEDPNNFSPAEPFSKMIDCPWFLAGSNGFDGQHFGAAHDRELISAPEISTPSPFSRRAAAYFRVAGDTWRDVATRILSGNTVTMADTDYSGSLVFVTAKFRRSTSYGMVNVRSLGPNKTVAEVIVWIPRSRTWLGRATFDVLQKKARSYFIQKFLEPDAENLQGCVYRPERFIGADAALGDYFTWLASAANGRPQETNVPTL